GEGQFAQALVGGGGDLGHVQAALGQLGAHELGQFAGFGHVDLVQHHQLRAFAQRQPATGDVQVGSVGGKLLLDDVQVADRVPVRLECGAVEYVHDHRTAFDVPQELQTEALTGTGARDQPGHSGDGEPVLPGLHHTEVGGQSGEGVLGDLRPGGGQGRHQ